MRSAFFTALLVLVGTGCANQNHSKPLVERGNTYSNPVVAQSLPDPTLIRANGSFYLFATEDTRNVPILKSSNLVDWTMVGTAFTDSTRPNFEPKGGIWAPDINVLDGRYLLYYSMSAWGGEWTCGVGVATADRPEGPFVDRGKLFRSHEIGVQNSIDPFFIREGGRNYLFWGSFRGIYGIELSADGLSVMPGCQPQQVAGTAFEGTYIHKKGAFYYLFASVGTCCQGLNSTYKLVVGRSTNLFGPYVDKMGKAMLDNGFDIVVGKSERFVGNGHCSEIVTDNAGADWILFHGVDVTNPRGRVLLLNQLNWDKSGWPYIENGTPSVTSCSPDF